ncbi:MAG: CYTH domain-containing protein [Firmicutes bacterium]|nr:CYTH domain-containing protein [Bacillota bacterium]
MTNQSGSQVDSTSGTSSPLEIERKWMVNGWPETTPPLPVLKEESMRQGYITVEPTVRIREESVKGGATACILCFKSKGLLTRKEIEIEISREKFLQLEDLIALPLIPKIRRTYKLPSGLSLEVNHVDEGLPTEFWYAEIEFDSEDAANMYDPSADDLKAYLSDDVTGQPGQSMGAYWIKTRCAAEH